MSAMGVIPYAIAYVHLGVCAGATAFFIARRSERIPLGAETAIGFLAGLLIGKW